MQRISFATLGLEIYTRISGATPKTDVEKWADLNLDYRHPAFELN